MFWVLNKKMILLNAVLHLKYEKITVISNMQLLHYIDTVLLLVQDPYTDMYLLWHTGSKSLLEISSISSLSRISSLYLKFIWNFQVSWNFWSTNFHESVSLFNHCSIFKEKISVANFEKKKNSMWQDWEPIQGRRIHSS